MFSNSRSVRCILATEILCGGWIQWIQHQKILSWTCQRVWPLPLPNATRHLLEALSRWTPKNFGEKALPCLAEISVILFLPRWSVFLPSFHSHLPRPSFLRMSFFRWKMICENGKPSTSQASFILQLGLRVLCPHCDAPNHYMKIARNSLPCCDLVMTSAGPMLYLCVGWFHVESQQHWMSLFEVIRFLHKHSFIHSFIL